tara:strand:+ start:703 stop:1689 length:987 start_codon:yes stop_codon:yes gene_type:complete
VETTRRRRIFRDVVRGYTTTLLDGEFVYIKHLTPHDQVELEEIEEKYYQSAQRRGVPTEAEMLAYLKEEGQWTDADEKVITEKTLYLENLKTTLNKLILKADVERQKSIISKETKLLNEKTAQKIQLVGNTCERYAKDRLNDFYIIKSFYKNQELTEQLFTQDEYDELESHDIKKVVLKYNELFESFSEEGIQYTILEDFYHPYLGFAEDSMQFYGKPFCELTYNQIRLIVYTRVFKNIFDNNENIPESIRKDPAKLIEFGSSSKEERDKAKDKLDKGDGGTIVGAKKEDYERLGVKKPSGSVSLHEEAKKKGGTLNMEDLMKLHGVT